MEFGEFGVPVCVCVCVNVPLFDSHFLLRRLTPSGSPPSLSGGDAGAHRTPEPPTPEALRGLLRSLLPSAPPRRWLRSPPHSGAPPPEALRGSTPEPVALRPPPEVAPEPTALRSPPLRRLSGVLLRSLTPSRAPRR